MDAARIETCRSDLQEVVVAVSGEIDIALRTRLVSSIRAAVGIPGVKTVVVDLTHTSFMDASGIGALVIGREDARTAGVGYRVIGVAGQVRQLLEVTNMTEALEDPALPDRDRGTRSGFTESTAYPAYGPTRPSVPR